MYFDNAEGPVFRPPSEADSFILRVTTGCSHNRCTYCSMYRSVQFRVRPMAEITAQIDAAKQYAQYVRRIFLADGNALILATDKLLAVLDAVREAFPRLQRVSCYAGPKDILNKTPEQLAILRNAGLKLVYYGMESGDDAVLKQVEKGVNSTQSIEAGQRIVAADIKLSIMVISGLGGKERSESHASNTALAVNAIRPNMLSALTLMLHKGSELFDQFECGKFIPLSPVEVMEEMRLLISAIDLPPSAPCIFRSNHVSNHVSLSATLPKDKDVLLENIKTASIGLAQFTDWDPYNNNGSF